MTQNHDYKVLILTSDPDTIDHVTQVGETHFPNPTVLFWEMGNMSTKPTVLQQIEDTQYNLLISYINGIILKRRHLDKAHFGSINIHPAPPEHGGAWGIWSQPVICRGFRTHHGVTVHEMDEDIDHGPIYQVQRWEVSEDATIQSVVERSFSDCMVAYERVTEELGRSSNGTRCFDDIGEEWHPTNRNHSVVHVRQWFEALDSAHPAHQERIPFNHPHAVMSPPYFDDV